MSEAPAHALRAAARSLTEVITPSLAGCSNPLAVEQARLVAQYLTFLADRWSDIPNLAAFELRHQIDLGEAVLQIHDEYAQPAVALSTAVDDARAARDSASSTSEAGDRARRGILTAISALVRDLGNQRSPLRERVEAVVTGFEAELIGVRRSWFLPQGWEPDPTAVPPLDLTSNRTRRI